MKFLADYCYCYSNNLTIFGYPARWLFNVSTIYLVPMVNPDGVDLVTDNLNKTSLAYLNAISISRQFPDIPFPSRLES